MIGLIGQKIGMTQRFDSQSRLIPVTAVRVLPNTVIGTRSKEREGYNAVVLGSSISRGALFSKSLRGQFESRKIAPHKKLMECRDYPKDCEIGDVLKVDLFKDMTFVDVVGTCKGKGFQGVIKRHGFRGGRKTHGSKSHREVGSTGMAATPSRVLKGTKMAGRMPARRVTTQNLKIIEVRSEDNVLLLQGAVPGPKNGWLFVKESVKRGTII